MVRNLVRNIINKHIVIDNPEYRFEELRNAYLHELKALDTRKFKSTAQYNAKVEALRKFYMSGFQFLLDNM